MSIGPLILTDIKKIKMEFERLFLESKGQPIIYKGKQIKMMDRIVLNEKLSKIRITFLSTNSRWKQGIMLKTQGHFEINGMKVPNKIALWEQTAPKEILMTVISKDGIIIIYNAWETTDGTIHYWHNGAAMCVEEENAAKVYHCNDGLADDDFDDLIFEFRLIKD